MLLYHSLPIDVDGIISYLNSVREHNTVVVVLVDPQLAPCFHTPTFYIQHNMARSNRCSAFITAPSAVTRISPTSKART